MLSVAGAVTNNKDLQRVGAIVGVVGGAASLLDGASSAASSSITPAQAADSAAGEAADSASGGAAAVSGGTESAIPTPVVSGNVSPADASVAAPVDATAAAAPAAPATTSNSLAAQANSTAPTQSLADVAKSNGIASADGGVSQGLTPSQSTPVDPNITPSAAAINSNYTANDLNDWWNKAMAAGKDVAGGIQKNSVLVNLAGNALTSMYGPQAEAFDYQKSIMDRARANLNAPVLLKYNKGTT